MRPIAFTDARILDPAGDFDGPGTLLIVDGQIKARLSPNDPIPADAEIKPCDGLAITPGLVDSRAFCGEPGADHRETIASLGRAAAAGGVTTIAMMPDASPVLDEAAMIAFVREVAERDSMVRILPSCALTRGLEGERLAELGLMLDAGAAFASQGKRGIADAALLRRAMLYARDFDAVVDLPPVDAHLATGVMTSGSWSSWLGLPSSPPDAETIPLLRDLELARSTSVKLNIAGLSLHRSVEHLVRAKNDGTNVSASVSINHLSLNETDVGAYRTFFRLDPPLRAEVERLALVEALREGAIDMVCSMHDPQDADTKRLPFADAAAGAIGVETLLAALLRLYHSGEIPLLRLIETVTSAPAKRLGLPGGTLAPDARADLTIIDLDEPWVVKEDEIVSLSKNTAFEQARLQGRVLETWVGGKQVFALREDRAISRAYP